MKKVGITIYLILLFIIIYLLQVNFFSWFNIGGVKPNLFIILLLMIGLFAGKKMGIIYGILMGMTLDFWMCKSIGVYSIMLAVVGFLGGSLSKNFSKDSRITMLTMIAIATLLYEVGVIMLNYFINSSEITISYLLKTLITEIIYNSIITIIIYPLIMNLGVKIEENFQENRILTRYF